VTIDRPHSKLPPDPAYWDRLERAIREDAAAPLAAYAAMSDGDGGTWSGMLARRAAWWVAVVSAVIAILWLTLPSRGVSPALAWIEASLAPDETAGALVSGDAPPAVDIVLAQFPSSGDPEGQERQR